MFGINTPKRFLVEYFDGNVTTVDLIEAEYAQAFGDGVKFVTKGQLVGYYPHFLSMAEWDALIEDDEGEPVGFDAPVLCTPGNNCCCGTQRRQSGHAVGPED